MRDLSRFFMLGLVTPSLALASACYDVESDAAASERVAALSGGDSSASCGEHVAAIVAGQHTAAGSVVVSNTATDLVVEVFGNTDWGFSLVHVYAGLTPPATVAPGQFPYQQAFDPASRSYRLEIPLADIGASGACGETIYVAVHTDSVRLDGDTIVERQTGWAFGTPFDAERWGWYIEYDPCCPETPPVDPEGCTLTQGYWKTHNSYAAKRPLKIDWPLPEDEDSFLCDATWLEILDTSAATGDAWIILAHQYIAARLNVADGASTTEQVAAALAEAGPLLTDNCAGIADADRDDAIDLAAVLDAYNNGVVGPGHCE